MKTVGLTFPDAAPAVEPATEGKFTCPHCGKEYKSESALTKHIQDKHPDTGGTPTDPA